MQAYNNRQRRINEYQEKQSNRPTELQEFDRLNKKEYDVENKEEIPHSSQIRQLFSQLK